MQTTHGKKIHADSQFFFSADFVYMATPVRTRRARGVPNLEPITPAKLELAIDQDRRKSVKAIATPGMFTCIPSYIDPS